MTLQKGLVPTKPGGRMLGHGVDNLRDFGKPYPDAVWREAIFGSQLGKQLGVDDLMLQWLYLSCVLGSQPPSFKCYLKGLVAEVAAAVRAFFQPRYRKGWKGSRKSTTEGKKPVDDRGVKSHFCLRMDRIDADLILNFGEDGTDFW